MRLLSPRCYETTQLTDWTARVSVASDGSQGDRLSGYALISSNGRYVTFYSDATNLASGYSNPYGDIFVHDRLTSLTTQVSVASDGTQANNGSTAPPFISADGRYVVFVSIADNLVDGDTNGTWDVFVHDRGLTYFTSGHIADTNNGHVPDVAVMSSAGISTTTNSSGYYTITGLITGTYTLTPTKIGYTFSPATRTVSVPPDATGQDFTVQPDLGFRPNPDGYSFTNIVRLPDCLAFQRSFSGLRPPIECSDGQPQERYHALFDRYRSVFDSGVCTGMASTSLGYYTNIEPRPQPTTTFALSFEQAWPNIATFHGRQYSQAVLDRVISDLSGWNTISTTLISQRVDSVYNQLRSALYRDDANPPVLDLFPRMGCGTVGHTVTPYRLDETDPLHPRIYVYENFAPGDANRFIQFDFSSSVHRFSYSSWDSALCSALFRLT